MNKTTLTKEDLQLILEDHKQWLKSGGRKGTRANLTKTDLEGANLKFANLKNAILEGAGLQDANLIDADFDYQLQEGLLDEIKKIVLSNHSNLEMYYWHSCNTTHCLSGWACHLNPVAKELEKTHGTQIAGLLTLGSEAHSMFFKTNEEVIEWLKGGDK